MLWLLTRNIEEKLGALMVAEEERLETPRELAERVGVNERRIRHLIHTRKIEHVWIGSRVLIPVGAFSKFVEANKVRPCQEEIRDPVYVGSRSATASTSHGANAVAAASARLAQATANKLKSRSRSSFKPEVDEMALVIPLKCL